MQIIYYGKCNSRAKIYKDHIQCQYYKQISFLQACSGIQEGTVPEPSAVDWNCEYQQMTTQPSELCSPTSRVSSEPTRGCESPSMASEWAPVWKVSLFLNQPTVTFLMPFKVLGMPNKWVMTHSLRNSGLHALCLERALGLQLVWPETNFG